MNVAAIEKLAAAIASGLDGKIGPVAFLMTGYVQDSNNEIDSLPEGFCGTAACVAGFQLLTEKSRDEVFDMMDHDVFDEAKTALGLNENDADALFLPRGWNRNADSVGRFTAERAVAVLRHLAATGKVAWSKFDEKGNPIQ